MVERLLDLLGGADMQATPVLLRVGFCGGALLLCLAISLIDARERIIPDALNAGLAALGLAFAAFAGPGILAAAMLQGAVSFGFFALFQFLYRSVRGVQGLGLGDVKFLGAAATWVGLGGLAPLVLVACLVALGFVAAARLRGERITRLTALPFGPFLALGLVIVLGLNLVWPSAA